MKNPVITVNFKVKPDHLEDFTKLLQEMCLSTLEEPGCLNYEASINGDEVFLYEKYKTQEDIDFHMETEHFKEFIATIKDMLVEESVNHYTSL